MNILRKAYCRTFQKAFHIAIPLLPYRAPKILESVTDIPAVLRKKKKSSVLIVTDPTVYGLGLLDRLEDTLQQAGISYTIYKDVVANPTVSTVETAVAIYYENNCDAIIGFGGGSSMDCAKAAGARISRPNTPLSKMKGILKVIKPLPLLIAIPTTAGTGSETTLASIIVDDETRHKYSIMDFPLIPRYAVLDPYVTLSLPKSITATTGMDALTHAVEAYIGRSTTKSTRKDALRAVALIFQNLGAAYVNGRNVTARSKMLHASFYAGCAFTKSYVGYVHAIAHSLGGKYNVPHGLANAVILPMILEAYGPAAHQKLYELAVYTKLVSPETDKAEAAAAFIQAIRDMKTTFEIGDTFSEIREEDIAEMAAYADKEANPLYPVPVLWDKYELADFYHRLMPEVQKEKET